MKPGEEALRVLLVLYEQGRVTADQVAQAAYELVMSEELVAA